MRGLNSYLSKYYELQNQILLCYRPTEQSSWADRCLYLSEDYISSKPYNHRSILRNEVVIEYDEDDEHDNSTLSQWVCDKLDEEKISYARWKSGNKSQHIHLFIDYKNCSNLSLLKNSFLRIYGTFYRTAEGALCKTKPEGDSRKILPDIRLCSDNHLIRAEYGIHEKTQKNKSLIKKSVDFPRINDVKINVWERYVIVQRQQLIRKMNITADEHNKELEDKIRFLLNSTEFRKYEDGRERALFILIHYLKPKYLNRKEDLIRYMLEWYRYSGGYKLTEHHIRAKVNYHWNRDYVIIGHLNDLLEQIGKLEQ